MGEREQKESEARWEEEAHSRFESRNRFEAFREAVGPMADQIVGVPKVKVATKFQRVRSQKIESEADDPKWICPVGASASGAPAPVMGMTFQVASVKKPLVAVKRLAEKGNVVQFGPKEADNFVQNISTGQKLMLKRNGRGSYLMGVSFVGSEAQTDITVDSAAEESVCPMEWGRSLVLSPMGLRFNLLGLEVTPLVTLVRGGLW